jgi:hypothetical protein
MEHLIGLFRDEHGTRIQEYQSLVQTYGNVIDQLVMDIVSKWPVILIAGALLGALLLYKLYVE